MNRYQFEEKKTFVSEALFNVRRIVATVVLTAVVSVAALGQYPGGVAAPSYGSKGAVIGGVAAGAAVGAGLLYWKLHNEAKLQGCVAGDGDKFVTEKNSQTYKLTNKTQQSLRPGERVELLGKKVKDQAGEPVFEVRKLGKDFGQCSSANPSSVTAQK